jgi:cell division protein DivIC
MGRKSKSFFKVLVKVILNKYFISVLAVIIWVAFFDKNDLMSQYQLRQKLAQLRTEQKYYRDEIAKSKNDMIELRTNPANLEKFAREKYQMKKDNEEIFVIVKDTIKNPQAASSHTAP